MHLSKTDQNIGTTITGFAILLFLIYFLFGVAGAENETFFLSGLACSFLLSFLFCFSFQYRLRKRGKAAEMDYLNTGIQRYILGLFMVFYGVPKLFGSFFDYQLFAL